MSDNSNNSDNSELRENSKNCEFSQLFEGENFAWRAAAGAAQKAAPRAAKIFEISRENFRAAKIFASCENFSRAARRKICGRKILRATQAKIASFERFDFRFGSASFFGSA